jgi:hypothetical protein
MLTPETRQPRIDLHDEVEDLTVTRIIDETTTTTTTTSNGSSSSSNNNNNDDDGGKSGFSVFFSDGQSCFYDETLLRAEFNNDVTFLQTKEWDFPPESLWDKSLLAPSVFEHDEVIGGTDQTRKVLSTLISTGLVVVNDVPRFRGRVCSLFGE